MTNDMVSQLKGNIVFFDFDGVLGTYQATSDKVHIDEEDYIKRHVYGPDPFKYTTAPNSMKHLIQELNTDNTYVLSNMASTFEYRNKERFIRTNYPSIKQENILFVSNDSYKKLIIEALYEKVFIGNYSRKQIILVEDTLNIIKNVESAGFRCYHISSFL